MHMVYLAVAAGMAVLSPAQEATVNPEYRGWAAFKPSASVRYEVATTVDGTHWSKSWKQLTLVEVGRDRAVVEEAEALAEGGAFPGKKRNVPRAAGDAKADPEAKQGEEEIEIGGKKIKCRWTETTEAKGGATTSYRVWHSDAIPGGAAKTRLKKEKGGTTTEVIWTAVEWKAEPARR